jgi:hypothetical protein
MKNSIFFSLLFVILSGGGLISTVEEQPSKMKMSVGYPSNICMRCGKPGLECKCGDY